MPSHVAAFVLAGALTIAGFLLATRDLGASAASGYGTQKVVYHINASGGPEGKAYRAALRNIRNHINAVGADKLDLKVVLHGRGVGLLMSAKRSDNIRTAVEALKADRVSFAVCNNTLANGNLSYERHLFDTSKQDIVPSGVAEIARLQQLGYA